MANRFNNLNSMKSVINKMTRLSRFYNRLPSYTVIQKIQNSIPNIPETAALATAASKQSMISQSMTKQMEQFSMVSNQLKIQSLLPSVSEIMTAQAAISTLPEIMKIQENLPTTSQLLSLQSALPSILETNDYIKQIKSTSFNFSEYLTNVKINFSNYFDYEDIYEETYAGLYDKIDFDNDNLEINEKNPLDLSLKIGHGDELKEYLLCNQKDVIGLPKLFKSITEAEAIEFINFLADFPYLGSIHDTGKKIMHELKKISNVLVHTISKKQLYRARIWGDKQDTHFTVPQMWKAPFGIPDMGRFNPIGINYLYMSDSLDTAISELKNTLNRATIMETSIKSEISILDISDDDCCIFELCNKKKNSTSSNPQEYLLPNFIAQCCSYLSMHEDTNIEGLKYKSSITEEGYCYVFFNKHRDSFHKEKLIL